MCRWKKIYKKIIWHLTFYLRTLPLLIYFQCRISWVLSHMYIFDSPSFFSLLPNAFNAVVHAAGDLHQPALLMSLPERSLIHLQRNRHYSFSPASSASGINEVLMGNDLVSADLCDHTNTTRNDSCFGLSSTHPAQARGHKDTARQVTRAQVPSAGIQHSQLHRKTGRQELGHVMYTINVLYLFCSSLKFHVP